ncbi:MAG: hypothetical protein ACLFUW_07625 [Bacteroidales bacterium]
MYQNLIQTVNMLKERVKENLSIINENEKIVRNVLKEKPSDDRSLKLDALYQENKMLLEENNDSIKLQLQLSKFLEKYKDELIGSENEVSHTDNGKSSKSEKNYELSKEDYLELTLSGEIQYNERHPYFKDEDFFNSLLEYYQSVEDYETCSLLVKKRKNDKGKANKSDASAFQ